MAKNPVNTVNENVKMLSFMVKYRVYTNTKTAQNNLLRFHGNAIYVKETGMAR